MTFEFGDVVVVRFPYTDQSASKRRPGMVVSTTAYNETQPDIILAAITSRTEEAGEPGDFVLNDWQAAGLLKPSAVKLVLGTFDKQMFRTTFGSLSPRDREVLRRAVRAMIGDAE